MTKRNFKYVKDIKNPTKIHSKTGEILPNYKKVSANKTTWPKCGTRVPIGGLPALEQDQFDYEKLANYMIKGTKLKITSEGRMRWQISFLMRNIKEKNAYLRKITKLPDICIRRFKKYVKKVEKGLIK